MDFSELSRLAGGHFEARIVHAAVELGVFDVVRAGGLDTAHVASALHTDARATELLLNSLVAMRLLEKRLNRFSLTPTAKTYLVSDAPRSLAGMIRFDASLWSYWERLAEAVRSGRPARAPRGAGTRHPAPVHRIGPTRDPEAARRGANRRGAR